MALVSAHFWAVSVCADPGLAAGGSARHSPARRQFSGADQASSQRSTCPDPASCPGPGIGTRVIIVERFPRYDPLFKRTGGVSRGVAVHSALLAVPRYQTAFL